VLKPFGSDRYPPLSIPQKHYPHEWSPNASVRLRAPLDRLFAKKGLNNLQAAATVACATGALIKMTAKTLDPQIATTLALEMMIAVSRMRPLDKEIGPRPR
jgi:hypothetical protein